MLPTAEAVGHIPVVGLLVGHGGTTLHILHAPALPVRTHARAHHRTSDCAARSGNVAATSAAYLMTQNPADEGTGNGPGDIGVATILYHALALDPATLLGVATTARTEVTWAS